MCHTYTCHQYKSAHQCNGYCSPHNGVRWSLDRHTHPNTLLGWEQDKKTDMTLAHTPAPPHTPDHNDHSAPRPSPRPHTLHHTTPTPQDMHTHHPDRSCPPYIGDHNHHNDSHHSSWIHSHQNKMSAYRQDTLSHTAHPNKPGPYHKCCYMHHNAPKHSTHRHKHPHTTASQGDIHMSRRDISHQPDTPCHNCRS